MNWRRELLLDSSASQMRPTVECIFVASTIVFYVSRTNLAYFFVLLRYELLMYLLIINIPCLVSRYGRFLVPTLISRKPKISGSSELLIIGRIVPL